MSSLRGTYFSSVFFTFPRGKERYFETKAHEYLGFRCLDFSENLTSV